MRTVWKKWTGVALAAAMLAQAGGMTAFAAGPGGGSGSGGNTGGSSSVGSAAQTGDNSPLMAAWLALGLGMAGAAALLVYRKRSR